MTMSYKCLAGALLTTSMLTLPMTAAAQTTTLRLAAQSDAGTLDPHAQNTALTLSIQSMIYEALLSRDAEQKLIGGLAETWEAVEPTLWRFKLRAGVTFQNGASFTAEDVAYSIKRAQEATSQFRGFVGSIAEVRTPDDMTVEIVTSSPDALLADKLTYVFIMDKTWSEDNGVNMPQDLKSAQEIHTVLNANGTGPFKVESREPDSKTVLVRNEAYRNPASLAVDRVEFTPIASPPTRLAALLSNEVDLVLDVPSQDVARLETTPGIAVKTANDTRTVFFAFDHKSDELANSNVSGNPFKDIKVRQAMAYVIDAKAIQRSIMRDLSRPTGLVISPDNLGYDEALDVVHPIDLDKAKALMAQSGYPDGFTVTLDCPTDSYVNGEQICRAVAAMLALIGINVDLALTPRGQFLPKLWDRTSAFWIMGFNSPYYDGSYFADTGLMTYNKETGDGIYNYSQISDPELDPLIAEARVTLDRDARAAKIGEIFKLVNEKQLYIPVHQQLIVYAMRDTVDTNIRADGWFDIRNVTLK